MRVSSTHRGKVYFCYKCVTLPKVRLFKLFYLKFLIAVKAPPKPLMTLYIHLHRLSGTPS